MGGELNRLLATVAVLLVCATGWMLAAFNGMLTDASHVLTFGLANFILIFDAIDLTVRIWLQRVHGAAVKGPSVDLGLNEISQAERQSGLAPYAIIASLHNEADSLDRFMQVMQPFKDCVWLIDDASSDDTLVRLRREGWNCLAGGVNRKKPGALAHLLKSLPAEVQTVVVMDPDCRWACAPGTERATLSAIVSDLQRSGAAALTPRVLVARSALLVECQALEYELSCGLGRKSLGELSSNSGVSIYRRSALQSALSRHTLSVYAEDLENSLLLLADGERIYYDDRWVVVTVAKTTVRALFSQRVGWTFGCVKVFVERLNLILRIARRSALGAYQYAFYLGICGICLLPVKLAAIGLLVLSAFASLQDLLSGQLTVHHSWNDPMLFTLWYLKSLAVLIVSCIVTLPKGERARHLATLPFFPFYSLLQYAPMTVGYLNLLFVRIAGRRLYHDHYEVNPKIGLPRGEAA